MNSLRCFHYVLIKNSLRSWKFAQLHCERLSAAGCVNRARWLTARTWEILVYWSSVSTVRRGNISRCKQQCIPNRWKRERTSKHSSPFDASGEKWSSRVACSIVFAQREGFLFPAYSIPFTLQFSNLFILRARCTTRAFTSSRVERRRRRVPSESRFMQKNGKFVIKNRWTLNFEVLKGARVGEV